MYRLQQTDKYIARLMMTGFFLPITLQAIIIGAACIYFSCRVFLSRLPIVSANVLWALLIGSGFLLYLGAIPFTSLSCRPELMLLLGNKMACMIMPIAFAVITPAFGHLLVDELRFFVYACLATVLIANIGFIVQFYFSGHVHGPLSHVAYRQYLEYFTGLQPTYMSMYLSFSVCIVLYGLLPSGKLVKFIIIYLLLAFLIAILAKSPVIAIVIIFLHYGYMHRQKLLRYKFLIGSMLGALAICCFFVPFIGQRLAELLSFAGIGKNTSIADNSVYVRKLIWTTDTGLIRQHWLTGVGPGQMMRLLKCRYFFYSLIHNFSVGYYDPHNEYFCQWISFGITGIIMCLAVSIIHFTKAISHKNYLYFYLLLILYITFFTESVLNRQQGILFYGVFTSLFFFYKPLRQQAEVKRQENTRHI